MKIRRVLAADCDPAEYIAGANRAFGHWGDEARFAWAFRGGELLFLDDVAASGINYRTLHDGRQVAIITGSWTLPEARGMGAFTRLVEATHEIAKERNSITISFGRRDNVSCRRVEATGAQIHPTFYCRSAFAAQSMMSLDPDPSLFPTAFRYTADEWRAQFIDRPHAKIECVGEPGEWAAIMERGADVSSARVLAISNETALPLVSDGPVFWFTTKRPTLPCEITDGFLGTFPPTDISDWQIQNGDRM
jgi:GNAT superfamily N-acetyltransferase